MSTIIDYDPELTEEECLALGSALTESLESSPLGRGELVVRVTTDPSIGAPAWYHHFEHTVNIDHSVLDIRGRKDVLLGAVLHELGHANYSNWMMPRGTKNAIASIATWMEEMRVEKRVHDVLRDPDNLRAMFNWLLGTITTNEWDGPIGLSGLWILTVGRYYTGVCAWKEIEAIDIVVRSELGDSVVDQMREILSEAIECEIDPGEPQPILDLAEEWIRLFPDTDEDTIFAVVADCGHGPKSEDDEDEEPGEGPALGSGDPEDGDDTEEPGMGELSSIDNPGVLDPDDDAPPKEVLSEETAELLKKAIDALKEDTSYDKPEDPPSLTNPVKAMQDVVRAERSRAHASYIEEYPSPRVRARAASLARTLESLHLPSVSKTRVAGSVPPGRLHGREMVRMGADRSAGRMTGAQPWKRVKRVRTSHKPIRVGCMTDTSGSMHWAETLVAEFAWTVATAGRKIGARTAAVTYGDRVSPVVLPETVPHTMKVYAANGGSEQFDVAAAALEGLLKLSHNDGSTKVIFNFSDGHYVIKDEPERARLWFRQWTNAGVLVFWIGCSNRDLYDMPGITHVTVPSDQKMIIPTLEGVLMRI